MMVEVIFLVLIYFYNTIGPITVHNNLLYNILLHKLRYKRDLCPSPVPRPLVHNSVFDEEFILLKSFLAGGFSPGIFWLGGTDVQIEGEWVWTGNVQAMGSYRNWAPGEPNNANGNEHCLEMDMGGQYHWNDNNCENRFNFICEMPYE